MPLDMTGSGGGGGRRERSPSLNVLGGTLETCSVNPMTGFFREGCCDTGPSDVGSHTVCVVMTERVPAILKTGGQRPVDPDSVGGLQRAEAGRPLVPVRPTLAEEALEKDTPRRAIGAARDPPRRRWNIAPWTTSSASPSDLSQL